MFADSELTSKSLKSAIHKCLELDIFDISLHRRSDDFSHIAIFFYKLGRKRLKLAYEITDNQQLTVTMHWSMVTGTVEL